MTHELLAVLNQVHDPVAQDFARDRLHHDVVGTGGQHGLDGLLVRLPGQRDDIDEGIGTQLAVADLGDRLADQLALLVDVDQDKVGLDPQDCVLERFHLAEILHLAEPDHVQRVLHHPARVQLRIDDQNPCFFQIDAAHLFFVPCPSGDAESRGKRFPRDR